MDYQSIKKYLNQYVRITLINNFWYRAKITSVSETAIEFTEERGKHLTVEPKAVLMIEETSDGL